MLGWTEADDEPEICSPDIPGPTCSGAGVLRVFRLDFHGIFELLTGF
jgi:hypothetical protein